MCGIAQRQWSADFTDRIPAVHTIRARLQGAAPQYLVTPKLSAQEGRGPLGETVDLRSLETARAPLEQSDMLCSVMAFFSSSGC